MARNPMVLQQQATAYDALEIQWNSPTGDYVFYTPQGALTTHIALQKEVAFDASPTLTVGKTSGGTTYFTNVQAALGTAGGDAAGYINSASVPCFRTDTPPAAFPYLLPTFFTFTKDAAATAGHLYAMMAFWNLAITGAGTQSAANPKLRA